MNIKRLVIIFVAVCFLQLPLLGIQSPEEDVSKARLLLSQYRWIQMHYFLQGGFQSNYNNDHTTGDYFVRHNRLIFNGQTAEQVYFFMQTDDLTVNETEEDGANKIFTQDAYMHYLPMNELQVYVGLMPIPFNRQNLQSAATTLTTTPNDSSIPLYGFSNNGRDIGIMLRGFLFTDILEYRFGLYEGQGRKQGVYNSDDSNPDNNVNYTRNKYDYPRATTRLQVHLMEKEKGMYYSENYIGKRQVFAIGLGFDFQPMIFDKDNTNEFENYFAISLDSDIQVPIGAGNATAIQLGLNYVHNNPTVSDKYEDFDYSDLFNIYFHGGLLLVDKYQPFARFSVTNNLSAYRKGDYLQNVLSLGSNYFIDGHHASVRAQYDLPLGDNSDFDNEHKVTLQAQVYL
jgi:hypothetical protein